MGNFDFVAYCTSRRERFLSSKECGWCNSKDNLSLKWKLKWWEEPSVSAWNGSKSNLAAHLRKTTVLCSDCVESRKIEVLHTLEASFKFLICQDRDCKSSKIAAKGFCAKHYYHYSKFPEYQKRNMAARGEGTKKKDGYRVVSVAGRRIPEHRQVMSMYLDRELLPTEEVHHKNGVRDDNRLDNLELWVVSQPRGQRAKDLLLWAREIIKRYEREEELL